VKQGSAKLFVLFSFLLLVLAAIQPPSANAQAISGDLVGTILDKTGAAVPNATVEAVNVGTNVKYSTVAGDSGEYRINNLPAGIYNISAFSPNFATTTVNGYRVELNKTNSQTITLEIKGAVTSVEVSGVAATLDTSTAQLQSTFEGKELGDLPSASSGAGVLNLSLLSSGVASSGGVGAGDGPSVGGQRPRNNNFTIEGVDNNNKGVTGPLVKVPNDAVAEFSLLQNNFSPEFGHSSGGQFNTVVKSGTNDFHGMAYIYNENKNYNALDTQQLLAGFDSVPRFDQNRIGGQLGGPVLKNKVFFFVNYEYEPLGQVGNGGGVCAPTAASIAVINAAPGVSATNLAVFNQYVQPGTIPTASCEPITGFGAPLETQGIAIVAPNFNNSKFLTTSMDYNISSKDQLRGRYIYNSVVGIDTAANIPEFFTPFPNKFHLITINEYHTFSPTVTNEFRLGYNRFTQTVDAGNFTFPGLDMFPNLTIDDLNFLQIGPDGNAPQFTIQNTYQIDDAVTWTRGKHTLKFGIEGRKSISPQSFTQRVRGDYEYGTLSGFLSDDAPDIFAERSNGNTIFYGDQSSIYWYVNDNWRIRRNLTINLGLRYEYTTIPFTLRRQSLNSDASVPGLIDISEPRAAKNNWGPRVGFAYSPGASGRTSIRGGFGIAYDVLYDNLGLLSLPPQLGSTNDCDSTGGGYPCPAGFLASGGILPGSGGLNTFPDVISQREATAAYVPVDQKTPKSLDWTLGVQHTFLNDFTVEVRYVGTRGIHLPTQIQLNKQSVVTPSFFLPTYTSMPDQGTIDSLTTTLAQFNAVKNAGGNYVPAYFDAGFDGATVTSYQPFGSSTYHGLATQVTKRMSHGLQFVAAYTYSHNIDNATADVFSTVLSPRRAQDSQNISADRSNSILDHRHRLTLSLIYDVPFFKNGNRFLKNTLGNWEFAPIYTYQSGQWVTAQSAVDSNGNGDAAPDRTIWNASGKAGTGTGVNPICTSAMPAFGVCGENDFDPDNGAPGTDNFDSTPYVVGYVAQNGNARYIQAGVGALANVGRNTLQLQAINNIDLTAVKRFNITERFKVEFQAQFFNLFNHPQYIGGFLNDITSLGFTGSERNVLTPSSSDFNNPSTQFASNARVIQLALKFSF